MIIESVGQVIEASELIKQLETENENLADCIKARDYMKDNGYEWEAKFGDSTIEEVKARRQNIVNQLKDLFGIKDAETYTYYNKSRPDPLLKTLESLFNPEDIMDL